MPEHSMHADQELENLLEAVRLRRGFETADEALEWMVKTRLARIAGTADASPRVRRRTLQLVRKGGPV